jgi:hypothetical protein
MLGQLQSCADCCELAPPVAFSSIQFENTRRTSMGTILIVLLVLLLLGALPTWPYSGSWGYYPSGGLGLVLLIVLILALTGRV